MKQISDIDWPSDLKPKIDGLVDSLREMESVLVAFSGGVDSAFLATVAGMVLGDHAMAVTFVSPIFPRWEIDEAVELAQELGMRHRLVDLGGLHSPALEQNPEDRCYHCKLELCRRARAMADELGFKQIADGTNVNDLGDYRPGMKAAQEMGVRGPLKDNGFAKEDIRHASRLLGLPTADKPSYACLATRFPYGTRITEEGLRAVEHAEAGLRDLGFKQVRVRVHGNMARIELDPADLARAAEGETRAKIVALLQEGGFTFVTLDLLGYRTGSMNETT